MRTSMLGVMLLHVLPGCISDDADPDDLDSAGTTVGVPFTTGMFCPSDFSFDGTYQLCLSGTEAVGPFPRSMIADCRRFVPDRPDGTSSCETTSDGRPATRWARSLAIGVRDHTLGPSGCATGTTRDARTGYCTDGGNLYGPFTELVVQRCKQYGGGSACETNRIAPALVDAAVGDWAYPLPIDLGVREDSFGGGAFGATRSNSAGTHSGIDFLAPVGTKVFAVCATSDVQTGYDSGYGRWVQLACPAPASLSGGRALWASVLYAHLDSVSTSTGGSVAQGALIGRVGKTGNAAAAGIHAHIHFEVTLHATRAAAHADVHGAADNTSTQAAIDFEASLRAACLSPNGVVAKTGPVRRGRRPDPYLLLVCSVHGKPALQAPPASLQQSLEPWHVHFSATGFDIDAGR